MRVSHLVIFLAVMPQCSDSFSYNCQAKFSLMVVGIYNDAVHLGLSCKHPYAALRASAWVVLSVSPACLDWDELNPCEVQGGHCLSSSMRPLAVQVEGKAISLELPGFETPSYMCPLAWLCVCRDRYMFKQALFFPSVVACCLCMDYQGIWPRRNLASEN